MANKTLNYLTDIVDSSLEYTNEDIVYSNPYWQALMESADALHNYKTIDKITFQRLGGVIKTDIKFVGSERWQQDIIDSVDPGNPTLQNWIITGPFELKTILMIATLREAFLVVNKKYYAMKFEAKY